MSKSLDPNIFNLRSLARLELPSQLYLPISDSNGKQLGVNKSDLLRVIPRGMLYVVFNAFRTLAVNKQLSQEDKKEMILESELYQNLDPQEWIYLERICEPLSEEWVKVCDLLKTVTESRKKDWRAVSAFEALGEVVRASDKEDILADPCLPKEPVSFLAKVYLEIIRLNEAESEVVEDDLEALKTLASA